MGCLQLLDRPRGLSSAVRLKPRGPSSAIVPVQHLKRAYIAEVSSLSTDYDVLISCSNKVILL